MNSTLYIRIIEADQKRGYVLLSGWSKPLVQATASGSTTLTAVTREYINKVIERLQVSDHPSSIVDITAPGIQKKLAKDFGEVPVV